MSEMTQLSGKYLADLVSNFVNRIGNSEEKLAFIKALASDHPTLQQGTMRVFLGFVELMADKTNFVDDRNIASVKLAKKIMEIDGQYRALPLI